MNNSTNRGRRTTCGGMRRCTINRIEVYLVPRNTNCWLIESLGSPLKPSSSSPTILSVAQQHLLLSHVSTAGFSGVSKPPQFFPLLLNPGRVSAFSFSPHAVLLASWTVVRLRSRTYFPSKLPPAARCITAVLSLHSHISIVPQVDHVFERTK